MLPIKQVIKIIMFVILLATSTNAINSVNFINHSIEMKVDIENHTGTFIDKGIFSYNTGMHYFILNKTAYISEIRINGEEIEYYTFIPSDTSTLIGSAAEVSKTIEEPSDALYVYFETKESSESNFEIKYTATFYEEVENIRFSNERVGSEVNGTFLKRGAYLSPSSFFYPMGGEDILNFKLTVTIPSDWESISDGNRISSTTEGDKKIQVWENPFKSDGLMFMAAPYLTKSTFVDSVEVACYFFVEDSSLIDRYLTATADYIKTYSDLIGPYPFKRFTVAENFFPTGYGMPGWTLLGQQVLRLPFIITTSLGHEVLHNWFGNSLYVDYEKGNWCESITVYGADYRYKLKKSKSDAMDYRKNILKQYNSYVNESNDFPIREFKSRTSPNTRTIGYNKAMMVFHMIEEAIGEEPFFKAWKNMFAQNIGVRVSWEDWISFFEKESGEDLSYIIPEWIDRAGAPMLEVNNLESKISGDTKSIKFTLADKSEQNYRLEIPVRFLAGEKTILDTTLLLDSAEKQFEMNLSIDVDQIQIDPDYHIFRQLYPDEVEPIVSAILGVEEKNFIFTQPNEEAKSKFSEFAFNITDDSLMSQILSSPNSKGEFVPLLLNPSMIPPYIFKNISANQTTITINEVEFPREGHTFVLTGKSNVGSGKLMIILTDDYESLPRIGQLVPHYGKYSYLVFKGPKNVGKGQWQVTETPLNLSVQ